MKKQRRTQAGAGILAIMLAVLLCMPLAALAGTLEPTAAPGPTMKTLDQIPPTWSQKLPAAQRFELVLDGAAVLDKETGLVWERSAGNTNTNWFDAYIYCYNKNLGGRKGWRLPTVAELSSLVDPTQSNPALPSGHPFPLSTQYFYWSSTELVYPGFSNYAWYVNISNGNVGSLSKSDELFVWAVRGGQ